MIRQRVCADHDHYIQVPLDFCRPIARIRELARLRPTMIAISFEISSPSWINCPTRPHDVTNHCISRTHTARFRHPCDAPNNPKQDPTIKPLLRSSYPSGTVCDLTVAMTTQKRLRCTAKDDGRGSHLHLLTSHFSLFITSTRSFCSFFFEAVFLAFSYRI